MSYSRLLRYGVAPLTVATTLVIALILRPLVEQVPLLIFIPAVALSAFYGGLWPGLLAIALTALASDYFFLPPYNALSLDGAALQQLALFTLVALLLYWLHSKIPTRADAPTRRAALPTENVRLNSEVLLARRDAEQAIQRITRSQAVTSALSEALTITQVADVIIEQGLPAVGAAAGSLQMLTKDGMTLELVKSTGYPTALAETWQRCPIDAALPTADAVRTGRAIWVESPREAEMVYPTLAAIDSQHRAWVAIPLTLDERVLGVMGLGFAREQQFRDDDKAYVMLLVQKCAQAIDRARLYEAEREARTEAENTTARLAFLLEASTALGASLNYESRLRSLAKLVLPYLADGCLVVAVEDNGSIQQTIVAAKDSAKADLLRALGDRFSSKQETALLEVPDVEKSLLYPEITDEALQNVFRHQEQLSIARELAITSMIVVPLVARGRTLGLLVLLAAESGRHYTEDDLALAQELARRAALSMDNARLLLQWREQRERLRVTLASIGDAVIVTDTQGSITFMNLIAEELTGWHKEEAIGNPLEIVFRIVNEETREAVQNPVTRVMREGGVVGFANHTLLIRKDNAELPIDDSAAPIRDEDETLFGIILVFRDVRERREAEARSLAILERTQDLYEISRQLGLVYTPIKVLQALLASRYARHVAQSAIVTWQPGRPETYEIMAIQHPDEPLPGFIDQGSSKTISFADLLSCAEPVFIREASTDSRLAVPVRERCAQMHISSLILFPLAASGVCFGSLALYYAAPYGVNAEDLQHMQVFVDQIAVVMDNIRLFNAEARARREAEQANQLKMNFLAMVSHELRTPLTSIKGFATTLLATDVVWDAESQHDFLVTINEEADKLTDLIEQLLDLSRLQAGKLRIHPEPRSIADILDMSMAQFEALARQHQLIIHIPADLPPVMADAQRISQVLVNLVENAVKYAPEGTQIIITGEAQPSTVRIDVQDEGPGIPVGDRERIFEPFRQSETAIAQQSKGIGLGLAICKGLIETHGGKIWVADGAEAGTTMSFSLPLASLQQI